MRLHKVGSNELAFLYWDTLILKSENIDKSRLMLMILMKIILISIKLLVLTTYEKITEVWICEFL